MQEFQELSAWANGGLLLLAATVIGVAGVKLSGIADRLADVTGLGEAVTGALLLGATTSLSGIVTSVTAAADGHPQLAISNAVGGIAAQTVFLTLADASYRRANLEHAAASLQNMLSGCLLLALLSMVLIAESTPEVSLFGIHPVTIAIPIVYIMGVRLVSGAAEEPMWGPRRTRETAVDEPDESPSGGQRLFALIGLFSLLAVVVGGAGYVVAQSGIALTRQAGLTEGLVGTLFTAVATSTPELVTTIAAVRRGALTLAVGGILGGNAFDVLFVAFADIAFPAGSIYHRATDEQTYVIVLTMLMTTVLLMGLLRRERHGIANIGFESLLLIALYLGGITVLAFGWSI